MPQKKIIAMHEFCARLYYEANTMKVVMLDKRHNDRFRFVPLQLFRIHSLARCEWSPHVICNNTIYKLWRISTELNELKSFFIDMKINMKDEGQHFEVLLDEITWYLKDLYSHFSKFLRQSIESSLYQLLSSSVHIFPLNSFQWEGPWYSYVRKLDTTM